VSLTSCSLVDSRSSSRVLNLCKSNSQPVNFEVGVFDAQLVLRKDIKRRFIAATQKKMSYVRNSLLFAVCLVCTYASNSTVSGGACSVTVYILALSHMCGFESIHGTHYIIL
jgi:TRAP-type mannitol/chloroaromatic compound transport system permease large subunit